MFFSFLDVTYFEFHKLLDFQKASKFYVVKRKLFFLLHFYLYLCNFFTESSNYKLTLKVNFEKEVQVKIFNVNGVHNLYILKFTLK